MRAISSSTRKAAFIGAGTVALLSAPLAGVASASNAPSQTSTVVVDSAGAPAYPTVDLPAVNKNFTETVTVSQGTSETTTWCPFGCQTTYTNGVETTNAPAENQGGQVGSVQYRVGNGPWIEITAPNTVISGQGPVQLRYDDGYTADNSGSYTVTVVRSKN